MSFRSYLRKHRQPEQLKLILLEAISGIEQLHELGFVHRDIKPDNIVLNLQPLEVRLIDFDAVCLESQDT